MRDGFQLVRTDCGRLESGNKDVIDPCPRCGEELTRGICRDCGKGALRQATCLRCKRRNVAVNYLHGIDTCADCFEAGVPQPLAAVQGRKTRRHVVRQAQKDQAG